ncbi:hypothetical protein FRC07_009370 [Ceratobasidium sp. 392]|nr:hypothetical protein FRC07_009370 [Ceratobasidium sp. 392]
MDSIITSLTVLKVIQYKKLNGKHDRLVRIILRDGLLYFAAILTANLTNCLMVYLAPPGLKVIAASFCQCITSVMVSRLQLNLRSDATVSPEIPESLDVDSSPKKKRFDLNGGSSTLSSLSYFFQYTVAELGRDIAVGEERYGVDRAHVVDPEPDIEMRPIQAVSGGAIVQDLSPFTPEETERLENTILVSPAIVEEKLDGTCWTSLLAKNWRSLGRIWMAGEMTGSSPALAQVALRFIPQSSLGGQVSESIMFGRVVSGCVEGPKGQFAFRAFPAAFWLSCLAMDSIITTLTVLKVIQYKKLNGKHDRLVRIILRDGLLYFAAILTANLTNCLMFYLAPPGLKVVAASFCQCITSVMVSRLQLNLRSDVIVSPEIPESSGAGSSSKEKRFDSSGGSSTLSSLSYFFQYTVAELGRDIVVGEGHEADRAHVVGPEPDIEMGPIQAVSGGAVARDLSPFTPEEIERLEDTIIVSPAIVDESLDGSNRLTSSDDFFELLHIDLFTDEVGLVFCSTPAAGMSEVLDAGDGSMVDPVFAEGVFHLLAAKYFMLASFVILVYDHILTFSDEVDRIWQREWTGATWLFALNRYLTELQFIVNLCAGKAFHAPSWTGKVGPNLIVINIVLSDFDATRLVLIIRTYALYQRSTCILVLLSVMWCAQVSIMATTLLHAALSVVLWFVRVGLPLPPGLIGCIQGSKDQYLAPADLKVIGASFSQIITIMMISRLQLNLRSDSICSPPADTTLPSLPYTKEQKGPSSGTSTFTSSLSNFFRETVTELGKDIGGEGELHEKVEATVRVVDVEVEGCGQGEIELVSIKTMREAKVHERDIPTFSLQEVQ